jgi:hypothetical protein
MNKQAAIVLLFFTVLTAQVLGASKTSILAENTVRIPTESEKAFYYGFAKGDAMIIDLETENSELLNQIEVIELPASQRFMEYNSKRIRNKEIIAEHSGIYKFRLVNTSAVPKICKLKIKRVADSDNKEKFNSTIYWRTVQDTTYTPVEEKYVVKRDTLIQEIYSGNPQIAARYAINGSHNFQIIEFTLPENTIRWSFFIGTGKEGKEVLDKAKTNFTLNAASVISKIPEYGPMAALALTGVSYFGSMQGEDNVKYWFLKDSYNVQQFIDNKTYEFYKKGDVITEACQMRYPLKGKVHLAVMNDNSVESILLTIKVVTVEVRQQWGKRIIQKIKVVNRDEPYLKN